jgi:MoaA/NifB/PqqE/SkfB family radical SAM enzyme
MIKIRHEKQANYKAIFVDGKTIRMPIDPTKTITELHFPEFYDVSFGTRCSGGCDYCYASALKAGVHYTNLANKIKKFFGAMTPAQRPYQMACGGQSESMENPECWEALQAFVDLDIVPNLTTNGMFVNKKNIEYILKYCGGVAVTLHPHLEKFWKRAIELLHEAKLKLNVHVIISDKNSVDEFARFYREYSSKVAYFVLLPYMNVGHAAKNPKRVDLVALEKEVDGIFTEGKLAFGANFYPWLVKTNKKYDCAIYPPEIFSKYILLNDSLDVFNNSFEMKPVPFTPGIGCELGHSRTKFELI